MTIATPTFVTPIVDGLTGDPTRSLRDSRITSSPGPLWMVSAGLAPGLPWPYFIMSIVPDGMGMIARRTKLGYLFRYPDPGQQGTWDERPTDIGGDRNTIWMTTIRRAFQSDDTSGKIYVIDPITFRVVRSITAPFVLNIRNKPAGIDGDGDGDTVWLSSAHSEGSAQYRVWKLDASLRVVRSRLSTPLLDSIAGDSNGYWGTSGVTQRIYEYTSSQQFVRDVPGPFASQGHKPILIGGSSRRLYCQTFNDVTTSHWKRGYYNHTLDPSRIENGTYRVLRTYDALNWDRWFVRGMGGI